MIFFGTNIISVDQIKEYGTRNTRGKREIEAKFCLKNLRDGMGG
jgi:hypothetical protein